MKSKKFSEALGDIDNKYIYEAINYKFKIKNYKYFSYIAVVACLCVVITGVLKYTSIQEKSIIPQDIVDNKRNEEATTSAAKESVAEENQPMYYSQLVNHSGAPNLDIADSSSTSSFDIVAFDESMLQNSSAIIEGEIVDMYTKEYEFSVPCDKFEANGVMNYKTKTVVYNISAEKVWYGDVQEGDILTVEDEIFMFDSVVSIHKGGKYVIPIYYAGEYLSDGRESEIVSGSNKRESLLATNYQFQPQIEVVENGYVAPNTWQTVITEDCNNIIMDITLEHGDYFKDKMYFVPENIFKTQFQAVIDRELK